LWALFLVSREQSIAYLSPTEASPKFPFEPRNSGRGIAAYRFKEGSVGPELKASICGASRSATDTPGSPRGIINMRERARRCAKHPEDAARSEARFREEATLPRLASGSSPPFSHENWNVLPRGDLRVWIANLNCQSGRSHS
jgi:hypothetical protein